MLQRLQTMPCSLSIVVLGLALLGRPTFAENISTEIGVSSSAVDGDRYYVVLLAQQSEDNAIKFSHTFAVFLRTSGDPAHPQVVETRTISWFPVSEVVSLARPAEPGINKSLSASLAWAEERGLQITVRGPFEIRPELYRRAVEQADRLDRGEVRYKAFDRFGRDEAKNCIHALADIVEDHGRLNSGTRRGEEGTLLVLRHFEPFYVHGPVAAEAAPLLAVLSLDKYVVPAATMIATGGAGH